MNDDTTILRFITAAPVPVAPVSESDEAEALMGDLRQRMTAIDTLMPSRADESARKALREEIGRMVADALQLDGHLSESDWAERDAATAGQFDDWLNGGDQR